MKKALLTLILTVATQFFAADKTPISIPFKSVGSLIVINLNLEGKPATMVLDTGAAATFVSLELVNLTDSTSIQETRSGGFAVSGKVTLVSFELNGNHYNMPVIAMNMKDLSDKLGIKIEGILGEDFLRNFSSIHIDFHHKTVELEK